MPSQPDDPSFRSDAELFRAASRGDNQAYVILCQRTLPLLRALVEAAAKRCGIPPLEAEDIARRALDQAVKWAQRGRLPDGDGERSDLLERLLEQQIAAWGQRARRRPPRPRAEERPLTPEEEERAAQVRKFYDWLSFDERELVERVFVRGRVPSDRGAWEAVLIHLRDLIAEHGNR